MDAANAHTQDQLNLAQSINPTQLPQHIAFIMDGNGRWATYRGQERSVGHRAGVETVKAMVKAFLKWNIPVITLYAFSTENWQRPRHEVNFLMHLFKEMIRNECRILNEQGVRLRFLGERSELATSLQNIMHWAEQETIKNTKLQLNIAFNYGGRSEIVQATRQLAQLVASGVLEPEQINEATFTSCLYTADLPDPDLVIRTSGEMRISNYLLWQIAYAELWVTQTCWPDFREADLVQALYDYQTRDRRYGKAPA